MPFVERVSFTNYRNQQIATSSSVEEQETFGLHLRQKLAQAAVLDQRVVEGPGDLPVAGWAAVSLQQPES